MTKRRRRKPEQIVKLLQEGQAMLAAGKSLALWCMLGEPTA